MRRVINQDKLSQKQNPNLAIIKWFCLWVWTEHNSEENKTNHLLLPKEIWKL